MHKSGIQCDLLRWCAILYGHTGLQLYDIHWSHPLSVLNLCLNLTCSCLVLYTLAVLDPFLLSKLVAKYCHYKPLFASLVKCGSEYAQPTSYFASMVYYLLYGRHIMRLLDSTCFHDAFQSFRKSFATFFALFSITTFFYLSFVLSFVGRIELWQELLVKGSVFILHLYIYISLNVVFYYQHCTHFRLRDIERKLATSKVLIIEEDECLDELQTLATINRKLNQVISLPVLSFLIGHVYNFILFLCMALIDGFELGLAFHIFFEVLYLAYIIHLNGQVLQLVEQIFGHFRAQYEPDGGLLKSSRNIQWRLPKQWLHSGHFHHQQSKSQPQLQQYARVASRQMRFSALDHLYQGHFSLRLFQTVPLNLSFLSSVALFILSYVVFITQTN